MARGPSGKLVIDIDPDLKRAFHSALAADGLTVKEWFIGCARRYLAARKQPGLPGLEETESLSASSVAVHRNRIVRIEDR